MYLLKALRPGVNDALTGDPMPEDGVKREILLPPDHYAERTGDISITQIEAEAVTGVADAAAPASTAVDAPQGALSDTPAAESRSGRSGKGSSASAA
ncbi:hypothetical protein [Variovorax sp. 3P27G3]|jgi:hypothetical protein|uniref:hypothetical protein n=1 Tax=Variovorax sp. 3P27G3 TaxID=2502214 RepID=UPI0010FA4719|nr:hypothetical protein [Variovorax sp. 3P27G3]